VQSLPRRSGRLHAGIGLGERSGRGDRQHEPQVIIGDLLAAEISGRQARSTKYELTTSIAKDLDGFEFGDALINETLVKDLAGDRFIAQQRNAVLVGGTGTGKSHSGAFGFFGNRHSTPPRHRSRTQGHPCHHRQLCYP
jgi:hypothetical protein